MKSHIRRQLAISTVILVLSLAAANATSLVFTPLTASASSPGTSTTVTLQLQVTGSDQVSGVDYLLTSLNLPSGFYIASRTIPANGPTSPFTDLQTPNATALARPAADLNPTNDNDLGASDPGAAAYGIGTYTLATYTIGVDPGVAAGIYTIQTTSSFWSDQNQTSHAFAANEQGSFTIAVPEPATWATMCLGGAMLVVLARFRRRSL